MIFCCKKNISSQNLCLRRKISINFLNQGPNAFDDAFRQPEMLHLFPSGFDNENSAYCIIGRYDSLIDKLDNAEGNEVQ